MAYRAKRKASTRRKATYRRPTRRVRRTSKRKGTKLHKSSCEDLSPSAKFALAQVDPFEPYALGAKVPDSNSFPSLANQDIDQVALAAITTSGHALAAIAFNPSYAQSVYFTASTPPGTNLAWADNQVSPRSKDGAIRANIEAFRPVAHAIRISSGLAPTTCTGFVHIALCYESRMSDEQMQPDYPKNVSEMQGCAYYKRVTLASLTQTPLTVINKWADDTAFRYQDPRETNSFQNNTSGVTNTTLNFGQGWGTIVVMVEGPPLNQSALNFEHLLMSECIPRKESFIIGSQAAPNSPATMQAVGGMVSSTDFAHTESGQGQHIQQAVDALARGASAAGAAVVENVAIPIAERLGGAAVYAAASAVYNAAFGRGGIPGVNSNPARLALT